MGVGLYDPLGSGVPEPTGGRRPGVALVAGACLALAVAILGLVVLLKGGDDRGEPHAVVTIERPATQAAAAPPVVPPAIPPAPPSTSSTAGAAPSDAAARDADVEIQNGVRIIRMRPQPAAPAAPAAAPPPPSPPPPRR